MVAAAGAALPGLSFSAQLAVANFATKAVVFGGLAAASAALMRPNIPSSGTSLDFKPDPKAPVRGAMGYTALGGNKVFQATWGYKKVAMSLGVALSLGPIDQVPRFEADGATVSFSGPQNEATGFYAADMWQRTTLGLTDAQWAAAQVEINAKLIAGTITEQQAIAQLTTATEDWPTRTLSNADLAARVSRFLARLNGLIITDGPPDVALGELNTFAYDARNGALYGPKTAAAGWGRPVSLVGPQGLSAKQIVINAGLLPPGATDAQFATWLADAQIDKVQPLVDAAEASATSAASDAGTAQTAATAAGEARTGAEAAQAAVAGAADATAADRLATSADRAAVADDRAAVEAAALATAGHASDAASAAGASVAAKDLAEGAASAAGSSAAATADDALATAADRQAVADDKAAVAADRAAAEAAAQTATAEAGAASGHADNADTARIAAEAAQAAAEQARDEAEAIAGGDFVTGPTSSTDGRLAVFAGTSGKAVKEGPAFGVGAPGDVLRRSDGDGRYRAAGDVPLAEVTGLADALDGKQNDLGFTPADAADTYTKGEVDAALDDKADLVGGKVPATQLPEPPAVPGFATVAEVRAGTADGKIIPPKVMADALATVSVTPATATVGLDFAGFINAEIVMTGNLTVGPPSGGFARKTGEIDFVQDATGGRTVAFHADFVVPANFSLQATVNGRTSVPYRYQANGKVRLYNPSKWSA